MRECYVYILTNKSRDVFYVGVTNDVDRRLYEHGEANGFAARYQLNVLVHVEHYPDAPQAIAREKQLKGWRRSKKIALITRDNPQWNDLMADGR